MRSMIYAHYTFSYQSPSIRFLKCHAQACRHYRRYYAMRLQRRRFPRQVPDQSKTRRIVQKILALSYQSLKKLLN